MPSPDESHSAIREALTGHYGRQGSPFAGMDLFEAFVSVILDRAFEAKSRDTAVSALREDGLLEPQALAEAELADFEEALRSAGLKIPKNAFGSLRRLARWLVDLHHGDLDELYGESSPVLTAQLRDELLTVNGVGPSTADSLLLFTLNRPVYPIDRATYRVLFRHGWIDQDTDYDAARDVAERFAHDDPALLTTLSMWMERLGSDFCRARAPKCDRCPLRPFLQENGPVFSDD